MAMNLQQLGFRIDAGDEVKADDIKDAYREEIQKVKKHFEGYANNDHMDRQIAWLTQTRDRLLGKLDAMKNMEKDKQTLARKFMFKEVQRSIAMQKHLFSLRETLEGRLNTVHEKQKWAYSVTDPDADNSRLPDYEWWGEEDALSPSRNRLTGFLAGWAMISDQLGQAWLNKAVDVYEHSDDSWGTVDAHLNLENTEAGLNMKKYIAMLNGAIGPNDSSNGLGKESEGFAVAYMMAADENLSVEDARAYHAYFLQKLKDKESVLNLPDEKHPEDEDRLDFETGRYQMHALAMLMSPTEWMDEKKKTQEEFVALQKYAQQLEKGIGLKLKNPDDRMFLAKDSSEIVAEDRKNIDRVAEALRADAIEYSEKQGESLKSTHKSVSEAADRMIERNDALEHFSDEEIDVIHQRLDYAKKDMDKILVGEFNSTDELLVISKQVDSSLTYMESILKKVREMDKELDDEAARQEEKRKADEREAARRKEEEKNRPSPSPTPAPMPGPRRSTLKKHAEVAPDNVADKLRAKLMILVEDDKKLAAAGKSVEKILKDAKELLDDLKKNYPKDPDLFALEKTYKDLKGDFDAKKETRIDTAFEEIATEMKDEVEKAGVKKVGIEEIEGEGSNSLQEAVDQLKKMEIQPSYVVQSSNPNAKTVVLFMQVHANPSGVKVDDELVEATKDFGDPLSMRSMQSSQKEIFEAITRAQESGFIDTVYDEGIPRGHSLELPQVNKEELPAAIEKMKKSVPEQYRDEFDSATLQAKLVAGKGLDVRGYDFDELKGLILRGEESLKYRMHAHNAFIASYLADQVLRSSDEVSFMTIGALHESYAKGGKPHDLPISHAMAYHGMNVVVVDAANKERIS